MGLEAKAEGSHSVASGEANASCVILKFGSSVLTELGDLDIVVSEIYRHARFGQNVVAVVSAFAGETDALIASASSLGAGANSRHAPRLIALGEERAAALLALACENAGLDARILGARQLSLRAGGAVDNAQPISADLDILKSELGRHDVVIVPGFVALGETGEPVLLGRGGTDLTAVFLAEQLGIGGVTLIKDVPGVFTHDPATTATTPAFFDQLSWAEASTVAGELVQPKSIDFAAARNVAIHVRKAGAASGTLISNNSSPPYERKDAQPLRIAIAGLGVIGAGAVSQVTRASDDYSLIACLVRDLAKKRSIDIGDDLITDDSDALFTESPDIIIDALSSGDKGRALTKEALSHGISVVTANKQAIAGSMAAFHEIARANGATFLYAAAVGGGAPMVETVQRARSVGTPRSISAIVNGTVNYILCEVAAGASFDDAVKAAQEAGFAEADPTADLFGDDARAKLSILSYEAFGEEIDLASISCEALTAERANDFARSGQRWKQMSTLERRDDGTITGKVAYRAVDDDPYFRSLDGEGNGLVVANSDGRVFQCQGKGAGRVPTVESLFADLYKIRSSVTL